nr:IS1 family transposase [Klebsiella pneumoniae]
MGSEMCIRDRCLSKSVELHDKVIGHYLNIKHYQ